MKNLKYVTQGGSDLLTPDSEENYLIIGTLQPCFGVVVHNKSNGFLLGFHVHFLNSLESMKEIYQEHLEIKDSSQVFVQIYSQQMDEDHYDRLFRFASGLSQREEMVALVQFMNAHLGIPRENINSVLRRNDDEELELGQYRNANLNILVNKEGEIFCTCHLAEDLMRLKGTYVFVENVVSGLDRDQKKQLGKTYTGKITLADEKGNHDIIEVNEGKVFFDTLRIEQKHNAAWNKMKLLEKTYYKLAFDNKFSISVEDVQNNKVYRITKFYFIPELFLKPEKSEAKDKNEPTISGANNSLSPPSSSQWTCCIS